MPETWTLTPVASNTKELYDLMAAMRGSTCHVRPGERRGGVRGVFDLIVEELTERQRQEMMERMAHVGLRKITDEERRAIAAELLLPRQTPEEPQAPAAPSSPPPPSA